MDRRILLLSIVAVLAFVAVMSVALVGCGPSEKTSRTASVGMQYQVMALSRAPAPSSTAEDPSVFAGEGQFNTETYDHVVDNPFLRAAECPLSTFSIDVDTASYSNVRRFLRNGQLPPPGAVRIEELVNYFHYDYAAPADEAHPFAANVEVAGCPWTPEHRLVRIALKGRELPEGRRPLTNLVFLLDVSGSMSDANKLPLVKQGMRMLLDTLGENDRVAVVVYAGASGLALPSTPCDRKETIRAALDRLAAGGSTNGGQGIRLAYKVARENLISGGVNRVILCTDGDFNVGTTDQSSLVRLVSEQAKAGVGLSVLGFGRGNYKDSTLEKLADKGDGNYAYIDTQNEARKVLVEQGGGTLVTIARDVKIQVEFNPARVSAYRLIGYENRLLRKEDFNDDSIDAGEIGAGHTVTALYEIIPVGGGIETPRVDPLRYQAPPALSANAGSDELLTLKLRYKLPSAGASELMTTAVTDGGMAFDQASADFRFAVAVAEFGMILRGSPHKGEATLADVIAQAERSTGDDKHGYRAEFIDLAREAAKLAPADFAARR